MPIISSVMRSSPCPCCGQSRSDRFRILFDDAMKVWRCLDCGMAFSLPGPGTFSEVHDYENGFMMDWVVNGAMFPEEKPRLLDLVSRLRKYVPSGSLLDVGCGDGHFLSLAKAHFQVSGVEPSKDLANWVNETRNIPVQQGYYTTESMPVGSLDTITMIQALEHIPAPTEVLAAAYEHLRPGGTLMIEVPSLHAPNFLLWMLTGWRRFVAPPRGFIDEHVNYFTPKTLRTSVERSGFVVDEVVTGRWATKYSGWKGSAARMIDPVLDALGIGGILLFAHRR